ncbi:uncharacterized protein GBIM_00750 [Gryllus bimaculatus]|nr:uncharacterized protein GBIM_00750 [Gryllus bimaculatus]
MTTRSAKRITLIALRCKISYYETAFRFVKFGRKRAKHIELPVVRCLKVGARVPAQINNRTDLVPWARLQLRWNDTKSDPVVATRAITEMVCEGVAAFFGPEGSCHVESIVSQAWNIPMIAYVSTTAISLLYSHRRRIDGKSPPSRDIDVSCWECIKSIILFGRIDDDDDD